MIPIVFWASLPPWPSEYKAEVINWVRRKLRSALLAETRRNSQETRTISSKATAMPSMGARKIPKVVLMTPAQITALKPALVMPAPSRPPIRAWLEEEGMPSIQVMMFQEIAPIKAEKITDAVTISTSIMPLPIVLATLRPKTMKAMKLKKPAQRTASGGLSTRVETTAPR